MADAKKFIALSMVPNLAVEVARQIDSGTGQGSPFQNPDEGAKYTEAGRFFYALDTNGEIRMYKRVDESPGFVDMGDDYAPADFGFLKSDRGASSIGSLYGGSVQDSMVGYANGLVGDGTTDNIDLINKILSENNRVVISPTLSGRIFGISDSIKVNGNSLVVTEGAELKLLSTGSNAAREVVLVNGDYGTVDCRGTLNANVSGRDLELGNSNSWGVRVLNSSHNSVYVYKVKDVGATLSAVSNELQNGGAAIVESDSSTTKDVEFNNITVDYLEDSPSAGFIFRIVSPFLGYSPDQLPYYTQYNTIGGCSGFGSNKNTCEIAGPNTRHNVIKNTTGINPTGQAGFEFDFGAYQNKYENCSILFNPDYVMTRAFRAHAHTSNVDVTPGPFKLTHDNEHLNCKVIGGTMNMTNSFYGFAVDRAGTGSRFTNPEMSGQVKPVGSVGNMVMIYQEAIEGKITGTIVTNPHGFTDMYARFAGTGGHGTFKSFGGRVNYSTSQHSKTTGSSIDYCEYNGGEWVSESRAIEASNESVIAVLNNTYIGQTATSTITPQSDNRCVFVWGGNTFLCGTSTGVPVSYGPGFATMIDRGGNVFTLRTPGSALDGSAGRVVNSYSNFSADRSKNTNIIFRGDFSRGTMPTSGTFNQGDIFRTSSLTSGGSPGAICISSGTMDAISKSVTTVNGSPTVTMGSTSGLLPNQWITVSGALTLAYIVSVNSATEITVSANATASTTATMTNRPPTFQSEASLIP